MFDPAVVERLLTKLSALRATLDDAERKVLDGMIVAAQPVELHAYTQDQKIPGQEGRISTEAFPESGKVIEGAVIPEGAQDDAMELHAADAGLAPQSKLPDSESMGTSKQAEGVVIPEGALDDGVGLHAMDQGQAPQSKMPHETFGAGKTIPVISIDEEGNYSLAT